ncbi:hypothetical protein G7070_09580 [Propioniciclava coleopterorum]|uniref:YdhG-like domain-containing protein n=1 Tax=Propioniciclava coleopterorum TaxID=2714937 RepID=A0A6G7Y6X9_9ACTN|nr:DUF1801 domain-containing protein [Propioniciclava coleopterorum]QIK72469.1 hypothetical protein G7070_09580 [Propioniciclava coleopterorum]
MSVIDDYLAGVSGAHRERLDELRALIEANVPEVELALSYGMPTYKLNGNLVHFATAKGHVGFYPGPSGVAFAAERLDELGLKYSKGAIQFPLDRPLPTDLIADIVAFRVAEQAQKGR